MTATTKRTLVEALTAVMEEVGAVSKRDRNEHQGFNFRGIDATVNAVSPALRKHGVVVTPALVSIEWEKVSTTQNKPATACRVVCDYVFRGCGEEITARVPGEAWDSGDKATPKAMSVAFRTALLQALALPTDDKEHEPDAQTYERAHDPTGPVQDKELVRQIIAAARQRKVDPARQYAETHNGEAIGAATDLQLASFLESLESEAVPA